MPEEAVSSPTPNEDAIRRLERRIENLEYAAERENRWWRGGLIAALVLVALSILISAHHRHHVERFMMSRMGPGMMGPGWQGPRMMPYGPPPPPPSYWDYGPSMRFYGPQERWEGHHRPEQEGPGPGSQQPPPPNG